MKLANLVLLVLAAASGCTPIVDGDSAGGEGTSDGAPAEADPLTAYYYQEDGETLLVLTTFPNVTCPDLFADLDCKPHAQWGAEFVLPALPETGEYAIANLEGVVVETGALEGGACPSGIMGLSGEGTLALDVHDDVLHGELIDADFRLFDGLIIDVEFSAERCEP